MEIRVGIKTDGELILKKDGEFTVLENMLIGDGFHWEKPITAILSGKVELLKPEKYEYEKVREVGNETYGEENRVALSEDNVSLINTLLVETYLECVVGSEMNPAAPLGFLKAHVVISRSWVLGKILNLHPCDTAGQITTEDRLFGWDDTHNHQLFHVCSVIIVNGIRVISNYIQHRGRQYTILQMKF